MSGIACQHSSPLPLFLSPPMLPFLREKAVLLNSQFQEHAQDISHLRERLEHDIELLDFSPEDLQDARDYLQDHGKSTLLLQCLNERTTSQLMSIVCA